MHHGVSIRVGQQLQHALRVWPQQLARIEFVLRLHDNTHAHSHIGTGNLTPNPPSQFASWGVARGYLSTLAGG
jgi:hypothetical protein